MKPWSITSDQRWSEVWKGSLPYKKAKTVMSAGRVMVCNLKDAKGVLLLGYLKRITLSPGLPLTRNMFLTRTCSGTYIHSVHAWLFGVFQLVKQHSWWSYKRYGHFLRAQDGAFYIEDMHLLLGQWSKCVHEGRDCVVIWKIIVLFSKTDTKVLLKHVSRRVNQLFNTPL